jgi:hypothetical protein
MASLIAYLQRSFLDEKCTLERGETRLIIVILHG